MSIAFDPNETAEVYLAIDEDKPPEVRATFLCRFLTCREMRQYSKLVNEAYAITNDLDKEDELVTKALALVLTGWRNIVNRAGETVAFSLDAIDDVMTVREKWNLLRRIPNAISLSESSKKAYGSPAPAEPAQSAPGAAEGNAATNPPS